MLDFGVAHTRLNIHHRVCQSHSEEAQSAAPGANFLDAGNTPRCRWVRETAFKYNKGRNFDRPLCFLCRGGTGGVDLNYSALRMNQGGDLLEKHGAAYEENSQCRF